MQLVIGRIGRAHGIRGELNVEIRTDEPERRFAPGSSVVCGDRALTVRASRRHGAKLILAFAEVTDRNDAETLHGREIVAEVDPGELPAADDEFYDHQLVGLEVRSGGRRAGSVARVLHLPAQDTVVVATDEGEVLVPFVAELVPEIDLDARVVVVADVPGLLDPSQADEVRNG